MDSATEAALRAIIRGLINSAPSIAVPDAITQSLYAMHDELRAANMPAEAGDVSRLGDYARDVRNARL